MIYVVLGFISLYVLLHIIGFLISRFDTNYAHMQRTNIKYFWFNKYFYNWDGYRVIARRDHKGKEVYVLESDDGGIFIYPKDYHTTDEGVEYLKKSIKEL